MLYLTDPDPRGSMGLAGSPSEYLGSLGDFLTAIDYKTGKVAWRRQFYGGGGGACSPPRVAFFSQATAAGTSWRLIPGTEIRCGTRESAYLQRAADLLVDGRQHVLVAAGDTLYDFLLY